ncbi:type VII secretion target [Actinocrispum wychmicini]|uniref:Excreted virulence factor EspC (Type VII ESX diderm) n=1 Tax=Actinocrispum wychmicini TaxID=1213861 RepID=A0A4R2JRA3_9PSEU|nr:type VII secretion target [Actinocrispum wychmicini]TCO56705.1 excreted virulence factor EspC (type VII ESX diderm) [Actinocrispum wychmicini]
MADLKVAAGQLRSYAIYLDVIVQTDLGMVAGQAAEGTNQAGFSGLLDPLKAAMTMLSNATNEVFSTLADKIDNLAEGLSVTADSYQHVDHKHAKNLLEMQDEPGMHGGGHGHMRE